MKDTIQEELTAIIQAITSNTKIETVFLFGSWAYSEQKPDSDLDIYLVIPDNEIDICDLNAEIRFALYKKLTLPLDLVIRVVQKLQFLNNFLLKLQNTQYFA
jgi:predicted nucleotidyltransferase